PGTPPPIPPAPPLGPQPAPTGTARPPAPTPDGDSAPSPARGGDGAGGSKPLPPVTPAPQPGTTPETPPSTPPAAPRSVPPAAPGGEKPADGKILQRSEFIAAPESPERSRMVVPTAGTEPAAIQTPRPLPSTPPPGEMGAPAPVAPGARPGD